MYTSTLSATLYFYTVRMPGWHITLLWYNNVRTSIALITPIAVYVVLHCNTAPSAYTLSAMHHHVLGLKDAQLQLHLQPAEPCARLNAKRYTRTVR